MKNLNTQIENWIQKLEELIKRNETKNKYLPINPTVFNLEVLKRSQLNTRLTVEESSLESSTIERVEAQKVIEDLILTTSLVYWIIYQTEDLNGWIVANWEPEDYIPIFFEWLKLNQKIKEYLSVNYLITEDCISLALLRWQNARNSEYLRKNARKKVENSIDLRNLLIALISYYWISTIEAEGILNK